MSGSKTCGTFTWLVWLSGLSAGLQTKGLLVRFPVRAHAWVAGQVPGRGHMRGNHTLLFLFLSFSFLSLLSKNKLIKYFLKTVVDLHNGILCSRKKEGMPILRNSMDGYWQHYDTEIKQALQDKYHRVSPIHGT